MIDAKASSVGLWGQAFIDGFSKPSYVVISAALTDRLDERTFRNAARGLVEHHPTLRSRLVRGLVPRLVPSAPCIWEREALAIGDVDVERELSVHLDIETAFPFRLWLAHGGTRVVAKIHHALVDAHAGRMLMAEFAALCGSGRPGGARRTTGHRSSMRENIRAAKAWLAAAERSPRVPALSVVSDYVPDAPLRELPIATVERRVPRREQRRLKAVAAERGHTFSELLFASLFVAMHRYNRSRIPLRDMPTSLGLMVATSRRRRRHATGGGFEADTCVLGARAGLLAAGDRGLLTDSVHAQLRASRGRHNDIGIAALVLRRRLERLLGRPSAAERTPPPVNALHLVASDLTLAATRVAPLSLGSCEVAQLRYLVSPVAADHGGLLTYLDRDQLCFTVVSHAGALDAHHLLDELLDVLDVSTKGHSLERPLRSLPV